VVVIPRGFGSALTGQRPADLQVIVDGSDSNTATLALTYTEGLLGVHSRRILNDRLRSMGRTGVSGIQLVPRIFYNPSLNSTVFIVPGLIAIILAMLSALLTSGTIVREREQGSLEQLLASPVRPTEVVLGKLLPYVAISMVNTALVVLASRLMFGIWPSGSIVLLMVLVLISLPTILGTGVLFSTAASTQQLALVSAFIATVLPSLLLSGFAFPRASMPLVIQWLGNVIPATHLLVILRAIYLKGSGIGILWPQATVMVLFSIVVVIACVRRFPRYLEVGRR